MKSIVTIIYRGLSCNFFAVLYIRNVFNKMYLTKKKIRNKYVEKKSKLHATFDKEHWTVIAASQFFLVHDIKPAVTLLRKTARNQT